MTNLRANKHGQSGREQTGDAAKAVIPRNLSGFRQPRRTPLRNAKVTQGGADIAVATC